MKYLYLAYKDPTLCYFYLSQMKNVVDGPVPFSGPPSCFDYDPTCHLGHIMRQLKCLTCLLQCTFIKKKKTNGTKYNHRYKKIAISLGCCWGEKCVQNVRSCKRAHKLYPFTRMILLLGLRDI